MISPNIRPREVSNDFDTRHKYSPFIKLNAVYEIDDATATFNFQMPKETTLQNTVIDVTDSEDIDEVLTQLEKKPVLKFPKLSSKSKNIKK